MKHAGFSKRMGHKPDEENVLEIKKSLGGCLVTELAKRHGVSYQTICDIKNEKNWVWVKNKS